MINIACEHCEEEYELIDKFAGKVIKCQSCGKDISIPDVEVTPESEESVSEDEPVEAEEVDTFKLQADPFEESKETIECPSCQTEWPKRTVICGACHVDMTYIPKPKRKRFKTNPDRIEKPEPETDELDKVQSVLESLAKPLFSIAGFNLSWLRIGLAAVGIFLGYSFFTGSWFNFVRGPAGYVDNLGSDDSETVEYAFARLKQEKVDALPALIDGLKHENPNVRISATTLIAELGSDGRDAALALAEGLFDDDNGFSQACMTALEKVDHYPPEITPALIKIIEADHPAKRFAILCLVQTRDKRSIPIIRKLILESGDEQMIKAGIAAAGELGSMGAKLVPLIMDQVYLRSRTRFDYLEAVVKIGVCPDKGFDKVQSKLVELIEKSKDDSNLKILAIQAIGKFAPKGDAVSVPLLIKQLEDRDTAGAAASALSEFGKLAATAIPALEETIEKRLSEFADEDYRELSRKNREKKVSITIDGKTMKTSPDNMGSLLRREGFTIQAEDYEKAYNQNMSKMSDRVNDRWTGVRKGLEAAIDKIQASGDSNETDELQGDSEPNTDTE